MKNALLFIWEIVKIVLIALIIVIPIRYFVFEPFFVRGQSMEPNFHHGNYLIIEKLSYRFGEPQRGEVIVFQHPHNPEQRHIKRIIGLPRETIEIKEGKVFVSGNGPLQVLNETSYFPSGTASETGTIVTPGNTRIFLDEDQYFVLGDNRVASADSRRWGPLPKEYIVGRVFLRAWPFTDLAKIEAPSY